MIASEKLNAKHMCIFAHISLMPLIASMKLSRMATGFMNIVGNKGAVAIAMTIGQKRFIFVNNHLMSGQSVHRDRDKEF